MEQNDQKGKIGCFIFFVLFVIGNIIYMVRNTSSDEFAQTGQSIFFIISAVIVYFIFKSFTSNTNKSDDKNISDNHSKDDTKNKSTSGWVILLVVVVLLALLIIIFNAIGTDYETNAWLGKIFWIIIAIVASIYFWINFSE